MKNYLGKAGEALSEQNYKKAIELYYKALAEDENNVFILNKIAHCYILLNNYNKAAFNYEKMIELDPKNIETYLNLAKVYENISDKNEAIDILNKLDGQNG